MPRTEASSVLTLPPRRDRNTRRGSEVVTSLRVADGAVTPRDAVIAAEVPVALTYNGLSHVVMMTTPGDLGDFALGFSLSEGILSDFRELRDYEISEGSAGIAVNMVVTPERFAGLENRRRNLTGRTGCGLCGVDDLTQVARPLPRVGAGVPVTDAAIHRALDSLPTLQPANRETGAVHAAAWAKPDGEIALVREDVGRHNALDKLIGAMAKAKIDFEQGFAIITSRCSFEMVQKAATLRMPVLVAISAPTTMALRIAEATGITLVALARADSIGIYANPGRIIGRTP
ncbi:MAG TPA: formate dehydrogenase accessory sulfurtransferase FdhD [Stellaceae bacterium]|nr:formate dehydrogenase accessory sulfurtransferase FdhD [Stellaceae bacterium]